MSLPGVAPYWAEWLERDRRDEHWEALPSRGARCR